MLSMMMSSTYELIDDLALPRHRQTDAAEFLGDRESEQAKRFHILDDYGRPLSEAGDQSFTNESINTVRQHGERFRIDPTMPWYRIGSHAVGSGGGRKRGLRFSMKAFTPSCDSSVP